MTDFFASCRALKRIPFLRIFPFFVLSVWLAACAGQPVFLAGNASVQVHPRSWAQVEIAKPTYTPAPTFAPTFTPSPTLPPTEIASPTFMPGTIYAEIVPDTPAPGYAAQQTYTQSQSVPTAPSYGGSKHILISISEQHLYAYEGESLVYSFVASTGMNNATRAGTFSVLDKIPNAYGATWDIWMPNWQFIGLAVWKTASMHCPFCRTAHSCGRDFSAGPFLMDVLFLARMRHNCCMVGLILVRPSKSAGKVV